MATTGHSLGDLVTTIRVTHHVTTRVLLDEIDRIVCRISAQARPQDEARVDALRRVFSFFRDDLRAHLLGEERVIFPYVIALGAAVERGGPMPHAAFRSVASPIQVMKNEQATSERALCRLEEGIAAAQAAGTPTPDWTSLDAAVARLRADLAEHVRLEQHVLFPAAIELEREMVARRLAEAQGAGPHRGKGERT
jgi:regulator of cell morphogenesis and NO signaling